MILPPFTLGKSRIPIVSSGTEDPAVNKRQIGFRASLVDPPDLIIRNLLMLKSHCNSG